MKEKIFSFIEFYKKSCLDVNGYIKYICNKIAKFQIFIVLAIVVCFVVRIVLKDDDQFNIFLGVIVSVVAACLFEGYRSYRKYIDSKEIMEHCCLDFFMTFQKLSFFYLCDFKLIHMSVIVGYEKVAIDIECNLIEQLECLKVLLKKYDDQHIRPKFDKYADNENYEVGIDVYQSYKNVLKNKIHPRLDKILNTLIVYSDDTKLVSDFYVLYNSIEDVVMDDLWPEAFRKGQPCTTYFKLIALTDKIISMLEQTKKYLNSEQRRKLKL